jgi:hypothetical protein
MDVPITTAIFIMNTPYLRQFSPPLIDNLGYARPRFPPVSKVSCQTVGCMKLSRPGRHPVSGHVGATSRFRQPLGRECNRLDYSNYERGRVPMRLRLRIGRLTTRNATMNGDSQNRAAATMVSHPPCSRTASIGLFTLRVVACAVVSVKACSGQFRISAPRTMSVCSPNYEGEERGMFPFWVKHPLFAQDVFIA